MVRVHIRRAGPTRVIKSQVSIPKRRCVCLAYIIIIVIPIGIRTRTDVLRRIIFKQYTIVYRVYGVFFLSSHGFEFFLLFWGFFFCLRFRPLKQTSKRVRYDFTHAVALIGRKKSAYILYNNSRERAR